MCLTLKYKDVFCSDFYGCPEILNYGNLMNSVEGVM